MDQRAPRIEGEAMSPDVHPEVFERAVTTLRDSVDAPRVAIVERLEL